MKPEYCDFFDGSGIFEKLMDEVPWTNRDAPRDECFMAFEELEYTYGKGFTRSYNSVDVIPIVQTIMSMVNSIEGTSYDICFLNYYKSDKEHLGWHADDSPEMDENHPIGVVSFGSEREIWIKKKGETGITPPENRYLLKDGSLFTMPAGFQKEYLHKIPKHDRPCGGRISLTFRKYKRP